MNKRASGILLHITSLSGRYGTGDFGPEAYRFADFLKQAKQSYWQILPLNPPRSFSNVSPYNCISAFAGNTNLISPYLLYELGLLKKADIEDTAGFEDATLDYEKASLFRAGIFQKVFDNFIASKERENYDKFCHDNKFWLDDYVLFTGLSRHFKTLDFSKWPEQIRDRIPEALKQARKEMESYCEREKILQYIFFSQWSLLRNYCNDHGVSIIGDIPIYVAYESADVWANPQIFKLDELKKPVHISGVPPDLFSESGQLWGNPIYNWNVLEKDEYKWWIERMRHNLNLYDIIRIDHFRGFVKFWQVPADENTALNGKWEEGPGEDFFKTIYTNFPAAQIIAEDLGYITPDVRELIQKLQLPGMRVLQFAFEESDDINLHLPDNYIENSVVYTGTHDNNTTLGWFEEDLSLEQKQALFKYIGKEITSGEVPWEMIKLAMDSIAQTAIIPMQDILALGGDARMNWPAKINGNWKWRLKKNQINNNVIEKLAQITERYSRA